MIKTFFSNFFIVATGNDKAIVEQLLIIFAAVAAYGIVEMATCAIL